MTWNCPKCGNEMKVNEGFQVAKCFRCGFFYNWSSPVTRVLSSLRLIEVILERKQHGS